MKLIFYSILFASLISAATSQSIINNQSDKCLVPTAVCFLTVSLIAAHIASPETYSWQKNTISNLGAQNYNKAWIMRTGFIGFGSLLTTAAIWDIMDNKKPLLCTLPIAIYGLSMAASGIFSEAPFETGTAYSEREANIHSFFANLAGVALTTAMLGYIISENDPNMRIVHISGMAFVIANSILFKINPEHQGIYQRILWTGSLTWLTFSFSI